MRQRRVYFPWLRQNLYGSAQIPNSSLISLIVAVPNVLNFSNILSGFWHSGSQSTMLDIHPLYPPWFFNSSQDPIRVHFVNATKKDLFMCHSPSSTSSTFSSTKSPHFPSIPSFGWMNFSNIRSSIKYCTPKPTTWDLTQNSQYFVKYLVLRYHQLHSHQVFRPFYILLRSIYPLDSTKFH